MRIGVISDTHDRLPTFREGLRRLQQQNVEAIFHAGDFVAPFAAKLLTPDHLQIPVHCIYGNNDGEREGLQKILPQLQDGPLKTRLADRTIAMHHYIDWFTREDLADADLVISGHDHTPHLEHRGGKLYLNPGECCGWVNGRCTVAVADLSDLTAEILDLECD